MQIGFNPVNNFYFKGNSIHKKQQEECNSSQTNAEKMEFIRNIKAAMANNQENMIQMDKEGKKLDIRAQELKEQVLSGKKDVIKAINTGIKKARKTNCGKNYTVDIKSETGNMDRIEAKDYQITYKKNYKEYPPDMGVCDEEYVFSVDNTLSSIMDKYIALTSYSKDVVEAKNTKTIHGEKIEFNSDESMRSYYKDYKLEYNGESQNIGSIIQESYDKKLEYDSSRKLSAYLDDGTRTCDFTVVGQKIEYGDKPTYSRKSFRFNHQNTESMETITTTQDMKDVLTYSKDRKKYKIRH